MSDKINLPTIPDEIWLEIFTKIDTYSGLKKAIGICQHFKEIISQSSLFHKLLWTTPFDPKLLKPNQRVNYHPVMDYLDLATTDLGYALMRLHDDENWDTLTQEQIEEVLKFSCFDEFATFPTSEVIFLEMAEGGVIIRPNGVKVRDVLKQAIECWNQPVDPQIQEEAFRGGYFGATFAKDVTHMDLLYDHRFFEGFFGKVEDMRIYGKGLCISLTPHYGS